MKQLSKFSRFIVSFLIVEVEIVVGLSGWTLFENYSRLYKVTV